MQIFILPQKHIFQDHNLVSFFFALMILEVLFTALCSVHNAAKLNQ